MILAFTLGFWLLISIASSFINTKFFLCSFLAYFLLVPFMDLRFMHIPLGYNAIVFISLVGFIYKNKITWNKADFKPLKPFLVLYILEFILIPFQFSTPLGFMINEWRVNVMGIFLVPFMMWNAYKRNPAIAKPLIVTLIICVVIICGYGILLTRTPGINPYLMTVLPLSGEEFNSVYAFSGRDGRVFGRISSVFSHPMTFGLFGSMAFVFMLYMRERLKMYLGYIILIIVLVSMMICGVRSALVGIGTGTLVYLLLQRKFKLALLIALIGLVFMIVAQNIPGLEKYLMSITDSLQGKTSTIKGSSYEMRMHQFNGALDLISDCPLQGRGFAWVSWYLSNVGFHPILLAFESLIFVIICNEGLLGFVFWGIMLYLYFFDVHYSSKEQKAIAISLMITYLAYSCTTGEYGYMKYMLVFYIVILMIKPYSNNKKAFLKI